MSLGHKEAEKLRTSIRAGSSQLSFEVLHCSHSFGIGGNESVVCDQLKEEVPKSENVKFAVGSGNMGKHNLRKESIDYM